MKVVAIIQARMSSSRLPGKVLADVGGTPLLERLLRRVKGARSVDDLVVATSVAGEDDAVEGLCRALGVPVFRGSLEDVLDRFHGAALSRAADVVLRLTADCPLIDPAVVDLVVRTREGGSYDYASNTRPPTYPDGLDAEAFTREALDAAWREAAVGSEREHVTPFLWKRPERFRLGAVVSPRDLSALRWTVDEADDLRFVREVYERLGGDGLFGHEEVLALLEREPWLRDINARHERNEGYARSLARDAALREGER